jgi:hypothetical protein
MSLDRAENPGKTQNAGLGRVSFVGRNLMYSNYPSQLAALKHQRDRLLALREQGLNNDPILAAAIQRQLIAASLGSSGMTSLYALGNQSFLGGSVGEPSAVSHGLALQSPQSSGGVTSDLSFPIKHTTSASLQKPSRFLVVTKIPCQARGMAADHNSIVSLESALNYHLILASLIDYISLAPSRLFLKFLAKRNTVSTSAAPIPVAVPRE